MADRMHRTGRSTGWTALGRFGRRVPRRSIHSPTRLTPPKITTPNSIAASTAANK